MMKKAVFLILFVLCLLTAVAAGAESGWEWELLEDGTARITAWTGGDTEELTIPRVVDGCPVTEVSDGALAGAVSLRTVTVPMRVRAIGADALGNAPRRFAPGTAAMPGSGPLNMAEPFTANASLPFSPGL